MTALFLRNSALWQERYLCKLSSNALIELCSRLYQNEFLKLKKKEWCFSFSIYSSSNRFPTVLVRQVTQSMLQSTDGLQQDLLCVCHLSLGWQPQSPQQRWKRKTGLCICATCSRAGKEQAKISPKGKCWMFFENIDRCFKIIHLHWRFALLCCFGSTSYTVNGILLVSLCSCLRENNELPA